MLRLVAWIVLILLAAMPARGEDANTLNVGGTAYRLDGIDAPESDQNCLSEDGEMYSCGHRAREELAKFIDNRPIQCAGTPRRSSLRQAADRTVLR